MEVLLWQEKRLTQTDPNGEVTAFTYDGEGNVTQIDYPDDTREQYAYDETGNLIREKKRGGSVLTYTYNPQGDQLTASLYDRTLSYDYRADGRTVREESTDGTVYTYEYDKAGRCTKKTDQTGASLSYTYNKAGNLIKETDANGCSIVYNYDKYGRLTSSVDPMGYQTTYAYDAKGNCTQRRDAMGNVITMTYDGCGRMTSITRHTAQGDYTIRYEYDVLGRVAAIVDEMNRRTEMTYDMSGNLLTMTDAGGSQVQTNTYDASGRLISAADALGRVTDYTYDKADRLTAMTTYLNDTAVTYSYTYDKEGRLTNVTDPLQGTARQTYDAYGNITKVTDAMGGVTAYAYDEADRITQVTNAIGGVEHYTYNAQGLLESAVSARGQKRNYIYDKAGRITAMEDAYGKITYEYDKNGNILRETETTKEGSTHTITRTYDALGRVTGVTDYNGETVTYGYDELGNRTYIAYPGGKKVRYAYYPDGNLKNVIGINGDITEYRYDAVGRLTETQRANGTAEERTYDAAGQLLAIRDTDSEGRLLQELTYTYDEAGNITNAAGTNPVTGQSENAAFTYDADNRLITYNGQTVTYDADGNMLHGPVDGHMADLTYDCRNRLIQVKTEHAGTTTYTYDLENIRIAEETDGIVTQYLTDRESYYTQVLIKRQEDKQTTYTYGLGLISQTDSGGRTQYYHYNNIGSTTLLTDESGSITRCIAYGPYGELILITDEQGKNIPLAESGLTFLYNGRYGVQTDADGLYYMRARYYNPQTKRFINRDILSGSIDNPKSLNRYAYVQGNPISLTDPFGLCPMDLRTFVHTMLDIIGVFYDAADIINAVLYLAEGDTANFVRSLIGAIPLIGSGIGGALKFAAKGKKYFDAATHIADCIQIGSRIIGNGVMCVSSIGNTIAAYNHAKAAYARGELTALDVLNVAAGIVATCVTAGGTVIAAKQLQKCIKYNSAVGNVKVSVGGETGATPVKTANGGSTKINIQTNYAKPSGRRTDFYVKPNGDVVPATGYRYMDSKYTKQTIERMSAPGSYFGFAKFDSASAAQDAFQISTEWSDCKLRGEFDTLQVIDGMYIPKSKGGKGLELEPFTFSYPEYGKGGYQQFKYDEIMKFSNVKIIGD